MTSADSTGSNSSDREPESSASDADAVAQASGLRDPHRAITALGAIILGLEALVLLLAVVPLRMLRVEPLELVLAVVLGLAAVCVVLAGRMRKLWAWHAATGLQVAVLASGLFHWALAGVGVIFGLTWWYAWDVRRKLSRPPQRSSPEA